MLNFDEAVELVTNSSVASKELFRDGRGFERSINFFSLIGNPQNTFRSIHIAGTSGKGTVAYMIEALLREAQRSTGLSVSPHVYDIRERCMVNGRLIDTQEFANIIEDIAESSEKITEGDFGRPTYFEMTSAAAFETFAKNHVDYGVIETGLGGLYDSTNTISRDDKLAVITRLGLDHTEILGDTISKIAQQKAGILPVNGRAVIWKPEREALDIITELANDRNTEIEIIDETFYTVLDPDPKGMVINYHDSARDVERIILPAGGGYQVENAVIAIRSVTYLASRDGFSISDEMIRRAFEKLTIPGRVERLRLYDRDVIFDGAHNPQKVKAFLEVVASFEQKPIFVIGLKITKDAHEILRSIMPYAEKVITTEFFSIQDNTLTNVSYRAVELDKLIVDLGGKSLTERDSFSALSLACKLAQPQQPVLVIGSFYLLGEIHKRLVLENLVSNNSASNR